MKLEVDSNKSRSRMRRWRFSLRALLLLVLVAAVVSAGLGWRWRRAQRQAAIVEQIRATGVANVWYNNRNLPRWLVDTLGDDFFSNVWGLSISGGDNLAIAPADGWKDPLGPRGASAKQVFEAARRAAALEPFHALDIHDAVVRREALEQLTCWEELTEITIDGCDIHDEDLAPLARAVNLRSAILNRQPIGNRAAMYLRNSSQLTTLGLGVTNVTDDGLAVLEHFPELKQLWLFYDPAISDRGMVHVGRCQKLRFLEISPTGVGDQGLQQIANLHELRYLNASKTRVTDEGLKHLAPLTQLEEGLFFGTAVTQAGVDQVPSLVKSGSYLTGKGWPKKAAATAATSP